MAAAVSVPECALCFEFPFNSFVGKCGHSICAFCIERLEKRKCPFCDKVPNYQPNFQMREVLSAGYPAEWKKREGEFAAQQPNGIIAAISVKHGGNLRIIKSTLTRAEEAVLCQFMDRVVSLPLQKTFGELCHEWFHQQDVMVAVGSDWKCFGTNKSGFCAHLGTQMFLFILRTKTLQVCMKMNHRLLKK